MKKIKFRSAHYNYEGTFNGFTYWGCIDRFGKIIDPKEGLASPTSRSGTTREFEEQFTGIKDKNGSQIFEGDIVRWCFGLHWWTAEIKSLDYSTNLYAVEISHNCTEDEELDEYTYETSYSRKGSRNDISFLSKHIEIIGNIHQNPELL